MAGAGSIYGAPLSVDIDGSLEVAQKVLEHLPVVSEDTSFVTGNSPATVDVNDALAKNGIEFTITNDGPGDLTFAVSNDGSIYSSEMTLKQQEVRSFNNLSIDSIRITWVADSAYRVVAL